MTEKRSAEGTKDQECGQNSTREYHHKNKQQEQRKIKLQNFDIKELNKREQTTFVKKCPNREELATNDE